MSQSSSVGHGFKIAAREFVTIVAGVLCALAAQAWWQGREDRSREGEYLRQLLSDTEINLTRLEAAIDHDSITGESLTRIGDALFGADTLPPATTLTGWLTEDGWASNSEFQPLTGTYTALISSRDVGPIRTDSLRALLVGYAAHLAHAESQLRMFSEQSFGSPQQLAVAFPLPLRRGVRNGSVSGSGLRRAAAEHRSTELVLRAPRRERESPFAPAAAPRGHRAPSSGALARGVRAMSSRISLVGWLDSRQS